MNSLASFEPNDVSQPAPESEGPMETPEHSTVQLPVEQLDALGLTGATAGQSYTLTLTVNRADEQGAEVSVDSCEANEAPKELETDSLMPAPIMADKTLPPRPKPSIVGPERFKGKF